MIYCNILNQSRVNFIFYCMKVQLAADSIFEKKQSKINELKQKQRQKLNQIKSERLNFSNEKIQSSIEVVDPLPAQLTRYKNDIVFKRHHESSKAKGILKKYISEQQRNLKRIRLQKIEFNDLGNSRNSVGTINLPFENTNSEKNVEQINIPKIQDVFKDQQKQYLLFESRLMREQLKKASHIIDNGVKKVNNYEVQGLPPSAIHSRANSTMEKYYTIVNNPESLHGSQISLVDTQIDVIIEKKLKKSQDLRERLYNQKKEMATLQILQKGTKAINFYIAPPKKIKKKVMLKGIKPIKVKKGNEEVKVTVASSLLFQLNSMSKGHEKKESELSELIQNSYYNRVETLEEKSDFYDNQTPFKDLSPSDQFKLRKLMDKKLIHRLQLSRQQINKFVQYISEIQSYHVILNETILSILKEIRQILLTGKVMKIVDLSHVVQKFPKKELVGHPNQIILQKLSQMMI